MLFDDDGFAVPFDPNDLHHPPKSIITPPANNITTNVHQQKHASTTSEGDASFLSSSVYNSFDHNNESPMFSSTQQLLLSSPKYSYDNHNHADTSNQHNPYHSDLMSDVSFTDTEYEDSSITPQLSHRESVMDDAGEISHFDHIFNHPDDEKENEPNPPTMVNIYSLIEENTTAATVRMMAMLDYLSSQWGIILLTNAGHCVSIVQLENQANTRTPVLSINTYDTITNFKPSPPIPHFIPQMPSIILTKYYESLPNPSISEDHIRKYTYPQTVFHHCLLYGNLLAFFALLRFTLQNYQNTLDSSILIDIISFKNWLLLYYLTGPISQDAEESGSSDINFATQSQFYQFWDSIDMQFVFSLYSSQSHTSILKLLYDFHCERQFYQVSSTRKSRHQIGAVFNHNGHITIKNHSSVMPINPVSLINIVEVVAHMYRDQITKHKAVLKEYKQLSTSEIDTSPPLTAIQLFEEDILTHLLFTYIFNSDYIYPFSYFVIHKHHHLHPKPAQPHPQTGQSNEITNKQFHPLLSSTLYQVFSKVMMLGKYQELMYAAGPELTSLNHYKAHMIPTNTDAMFSHGWLFITLDIINDIDIIIDLFSFKLNLIQQNTKRCNNTSLQDQDRYYKLYYPSFYHQISRIPMHFIYLALVNIGNIILMLNMFIFVTLYHPVLLYTICPYIENIHGLFLQQQNNPPEYYVNKKPAKYHENYKHPLDLTITSTSFMNHHVYSRPVTALLTNTHHNNIGQFPFNESGHHHNHQHRHSIFEPNLSYSTAPIPLPQNGSLARLVQYQQSHFNHIHLNSLYYLTLWQNLSLFLHTDAFVFCVDYHGQFNSKVHSRNTAKDPYPLFIEKKQNKYRNHHTFIKDAILSHTEENDKSRRSFEEIVQNYQLQTCQLQFTSIQTSNSSVPTNIDRISYIELFHNMDYSTINYNYNSFYQKTLFKYHTIFSELTCHILNSPPPTPETLTIPITSFSTQFKVLFLALAVTKPHHHNLNNHVGNVQRLKESQYAQYAQYTNNCPVYYTENCHTYSLSMLNTNPIALQTDKLINVQAYRSYQKGAVNSLSSLDILSSYMIPTFSPNIHIYTYPFLVDGNHDIRQFFYSQDKNKATTALFHAYLKKHSYARYYYKTIKRHSAKYNPENDVRYEYPRNLLLQLTLITFYYYLFNGCINHSQPALLSIPTHNNHVPILDASNNDSISTVPNTMSTKSSDSVEVPTIELNSPLYELKQWFYQSLFSHNLAMPVECSAVTKYSVKTLTHFTPDDHDFIYVSRLSKYQDSLLTPTTSFLSTTQNSVFSSEDNPSFNNNVSLSSIGKNHYLFSLLRCLQSSSDESSFVTSFLSLMKLLIYQNPEEVLAPANSYHAQSSIINQKNPHFRVSYHKTIPDFIYTILFYEIYMNCFMYYRRWISEHAIRLEEYSQHLLLKAFEKNQSTCQVTDSPSTSQTKTTAPPAPSPFFELTLKPLNSISPKNRHNMNDISNVLNGMSYFGDHYDKMVARTMPKSTEPNLVNSIMMNVSVSEIEHGSEVIYLNNSDYSSYSNGRPLLTPYEMNINSASSTTSNIPQPSPNMTTPQCLLPLNTMNSVASIPAYPITKMDAFEMGCDINQQNTNNLDNESNIMVPGSNGLGASPDMSYIPNEKPNGLTIRTQHDSQLDSFRTCETNDSYLQFLSKSSLNSGPLGMVPILSSMDSLIYTNETDENDRTNHICDDDIIIEHFLERFSIDHINSITRIADSEAPLKEYPPLNPQNTQSSSSLPYLSLLHYKIDFPQIHAMAATQPISYIKPCLDHIQSSASKASSSHVLRYTEETLLHYIIPSYYMKKFTQYLSPSLVTHLQPLVGVFLSMLLCAYRSIINQKNVGFSQIASRDTPDTFNIKTWNNYSNLLFYKFGYNILYDIIAPPCLLNPANNVSPLHPTLTSNQNVVLFHQCYDYKTLPYSICPIYHAPTLLYTSSRYDNTSQHHNTVHLSQLHIFNEIASLFNSEIHHAPIRAQIVVTNPSPTKNSPGLENSHISHMFDDMMSITSNASSSHILPYQLGHFGSSRSGQFSTAITLASTNESISPEKKSKKSRIAMIDNGDVAQLHNFLFTTKQHSSQRLKMYHQYLIHQYSQAHDTHLFAMSNLNNLLHYGLYFALPYNDFIFNTASMMQTMSQQSSLSLAYIVQPPYQLYFNRVPFHYFSQSTALAENAAKQEEIAQQAFVADLSSQTDAPSNDEIVVPMAAGDSPPRTMEVSPLLHFTPTKSPTEKGSQKAKRNKVAYNAEIKQTHILISQNDHCAPKIISYNPAHLAVLSFYHQANAYQLYIDKTFSYSVDDPANQRGRSNIPDSRAQNEYFLSLLSQHYTQYYGMLYDIIYFQVLNNSLYKNRTSHFSMDLTSHFITGQNLVSGSPHYLNLFSIVYHNLPGFVGSHQRITPPCEITKKLQHIILSSIPPHKTIYFLYQYFVYLSKMNNETGQYLSLHYLFDVLSLLKLNIYHVIIFIIMSLYSLQNTTNYRQSTASASYKSRRPQSSNTQNDAMGSYAPDSTSNDNSMIDEIDSDAVLYNLLHQGRVFMGPNDTTKIADTKNASNINNISSFIYVLILLVLYYIKVKQLTIHNTINAKFSDLSSRVIPQTPVTCHTPSTAQRTPLSTPTKAKVAFSTALDLTQTNDDLITFIISQQYQILSLLAQSNVLSYYLLLLHFGVNTILFHKANYKIFSVHFYHDKQSCINPTDHFPRLRVVDDEYVIKFPFIFEYLRTLFNNVGPLKLSLLSTQSLHTYGILQELIFNHNNNTNNFSEVLPVLSDPYNSIESNGKISQKVIASGNIKYHALKYINHMTYNTLDIDRHLNQIQQVNGTENNLYELCLDILLNQLTAFQCCYIDLYPSRIKSSSSSDSLISTTRQSSFVKRKSSAQSQTTPAPIDQYQVAIQTTNNSNAQFLTQCQERYEEQIHPSSDLFQLLYNGFGGALKHYFDHAEELFQF